MKLMKGLYVIHLPESEPDLYKIGCSSDIDRRIEEFNNNCLRLDNVSVLYRKEFSNYRKAEKEVHKQLDCYRVKRNKEFFKCSLETIKKAIDAIADDLEPVGTTIQLNVTVELNETIEDCDAYYHCSHNKINNLNQLLSQSSIESTELLTELAESLYSCIVNDIITKGEKEKDFCILKSQIYRLTKRYTSNSLEDLYNELSKIISKHFNDKNKITDLVYFIKK